MSYKLPFTMKQKIIGGIVAVGIVMIVGIFALAVLGSEAAETDKTRSTTNFSNSEGSLQLNKEVNKSITAKQLHGNPSAYKGEVVSLTGEVFQVDKMDGETGFQVYTNPEDSTGNTLVLYQDDTDLGNGDFVRFEGKVGDIYEGENAFGATISAPTILAYSMERIGRDEATAPAVKTITPNKSKRRNNFRVTLKKVEFAENETRVFIKVKNQSSDSVNFYTHNAKVVQSQSQIQSKHVLDNNKEMPSEILANTKESGTLYFNGANPEKPLTISFSAYSSASYDELKFSFKVNR